MLAETLNALVVSAALSALYVVPALCIARPWRLTGAARTTTLIRALGLAVSLQAVSGLAWNDAIHAWPEGQILLTLLLWTTAGWWWRRRDGAADDAAGEAAAAREGRWLMAILLVAWAVRLLHPLQAAYLGQSDAYIHLLFFKDVAAAGAIRHPAYPPGYHWVTALPTVLFRIDPYLTARYGGAWFGALLCASTYAFLRAWTKAPAALLGAFLVACCPVFGLLIKTGVGAFANQMGLALMPMVLLAYGRWRSVHGAVARHAGAEFAMLAMGLAASVPLMLFGLGLAMGLEALASAVRRERRAGVWARLLGLALLLAPAGAMTAAHFGRAGEFWTRVTGEALTGARLREETLRHDPAHMTPAETRPPSPWAAGARDLLRVKRWGLAGVPMNAAAGVWLVVFAVILAAGVRRGAVFLSLMGWLGVLSGVQTLTGWMEFSNYQRAGWPFMLAAAMAAGPIGAELLGRVKPRAVARGLTAAGVLGCLVWIALSPPRHAALTSSAEEDLVELTRDLSHREARRAGAPTPWALGIEHDAGIGAALAADLPLTLAVRSTSGYGARGFWEVPDAVAQPGSPLRIVNIRAAADVAGALSDAGQTVFFLDRARRLTAQGVGAMAALDARRAERYSEWQYGHYRVNDDIRAFLAALPRDTWRQDRVRLSENAEAVVCRRMQ